MGELTIRPCTPRDAVAVTDLLNATVRHAGGHPWFTSELITGLLAVAVRDPAADTRLYLDGDRLVAAALVGTPPPGGFRVDLMGGVDPRWRGRGIGREVFGWQAARAREIHQEAPAERGWVAETNAMAADEPALRLFKRFGFEPVRYFFEMVAPTGSAAEAALPAGLRAQPYRPDLAEALYEAHREAFADHWGYQARGSDAWRPLTVEAETFRADLSRIAFDGAEIAGYVLSYVDPSPDRLYIGQVGTRRAWRRRGLAAALLSQVLAAGARAGRRWAALGVDADSPTGAVGLYERAGFEVESRAVAYHAPLG
jgi:mycothiol synthase